MNGSKVIGSVGYFTLIYTPFIRIGEITNPLILLSKGTSWPQSFQSRSQAIQFPGKKWIAAEELRVGSQDDEEEDGEGFWWMWGG